ncbi:relaxase/mobilization nuclease domain-containing protein [Kocuria sp. UBA1838]|uniref:relaxase/mobilization nuclease domain-containing protein n=1 Tax=Kocuria sp. UBA1838 TaxID=1946673 RepID=UPI00257EB09C|nr:relaxase/mobilization nuclease domain-containing protein [Kocuria sp. UBA1838]
MGFAEHPWVMVRHADDHVHVVVCRVSDEGTVWHGRNDHSAAQSACTRLELEHGLQTAPRRREAGRGKRSVLAVRQQQEQQAQVVAARRAECEQIRKVVELDTPAPRKQPPAPQQQQRVAPAHLVEQVQHLRHPGPGREDRGRGL